MDKKNYLQTTGKAIFGAIPYVGTALNEAIFEHSSRIKQQRFETFMNGVADDVGELKDSSINHAYLESDDFVDLFESILQRVVRTRSKEKLSLFKKLFVRQIQAPADTDFRETFLDIIANINAKQIEILVKHQENASFDAVCRKAMHYTLDNGSYKFFAQDLISKGLMIDDSVGRLDCRPLDVLDVTDMGRRFLAFIQNDS